MTTAKRWTFGVFGLLVSSSLAALCAVVVGGVGTRARADSSAIDFETPTYATGSINGQDGWSATGAYDYGVVATAGFGSPAGFAAQSFRISNAITSGSFGDWAFSKSLTDEAGEPLAANGGFSGGTRQPHFEVSFDIASAVPGAEQPGLQISVAPDRGDGARMSFLRFRDTSLGIDVDFAEYVDAAPFGTSSNLAAGCGAEDDFVTTTIASGLDRSIPHNIKLVIDFVPGPRNDVVRVFVDGGANLIHCGGTWEDYYRYCAESQPPVDVSRTVDSLLLQARTGSGTAPGTSGNGFLVDNLNLESGSLVSEPEVCPTAAVGECAAPACPAANCLVNDATGVDGPGCCTAVGGCKTIQGGVNDAVVGDVIDVAAGTYPEAAAGPLTINKTLTLCGAQDGVDARTRVGAETVVTDPQGTYVTASNVVINGLTIQDVDQTAQVFTGYGILMGAGTTGTQVLNNIIQDNTVGIGLANIGVSQVLICQNLIQNNNVPGAAAGAGIYTDEFVCGFGLPCTNFLVEQNAFKGNNDAGIDISNTSSPLTQLDVSTNTFDMNGRGIFLLNTDASTIHNNSITNCTTPLSGAIRIFGSVDDLSITSNDLNTGAGWGIRMSDSIGPPNSGVVIHLNNIANFAGSGGPFGGGLLVEAGAHTGPVNAECNWWNDPCGPYNVAANPLGPGEEVQEGGAPGDADFTPWLIAPGPAPASGGGTCSGMTCGPTTPDHYKCYKSRAPFQQRSVSLVDQFGSSTATVVRPDRFCNPVNKNNEGITNPDAHLSCYRIREPRPPTRDVIVNNQFGEQRLTTTRTHTLCVPAIKDQIGDLDALDINHFKCYRVRRTPGEPKFTEREVQLADQFEIKATTVTRPFLLCNPVNKNGEGVPDPTNHLTCYKITDVSGQPPFVPVQPNVTDQFVIQDLQTSRRTDCGRTRLLCVPSSKRIASPSGAFLDVEGGMLD